MRGRPEQGRTLRCSGSPGTRGSHPHSQADVRPCYAGIRHSMLTSIGLPRTRRLLSLVLSAGIQGAPGLVGWVSGTALTSVAILIVNLGSGVAQARGLGPEGRGELAIAMLWPTLIASIGGLGIQEAIVFQAARKRSGRSPVLPTALVIGAGQTLLLAVIALLLLPIVLHGKPSSVLHETEFYLWILPLFVLTNYPVAFFQGRLELLAFNACRFAVNAASTAPLLVLWFMHRMTVRAALSASLGATLITAVLCFVILLKGRGVVWRPSGNLVRPIMSFGMRLHVGNIATIITQRLDLVVLSLVVATANLGQYAVATAAAMVASLLPTAASFVLYPAFARQQAATLPAALGRLLLVGGALTMLTAPLLVIALPLAVPLLFGSAFSGAVPMTALLALGYLMRGWNLILSSFIRGAGRPFTASVGQAVELAVLAGLLPLFTPRFGTTGAAISVTVGAAASFGALITAAFATAHLTPGCLWNLWLLDARRWRQVAASSRGMVVRDVNS